MPTLLIVNNGMKDQSGHYFETAASVAEAARDTGMSPVLAGHADCPAGIIPDWLPFLPAFRTEHWQGTPVGPPLPLGGVRPSFRRMLGTPAAGLADGSTPMDAYLAARLGEPAPVPAAEPAPASRRHRLKHRAKVLTPAIVWNGFKAAYRAVRPKPAPPPLLPPPVDPLFHDLDCVGQALEFPWAEAFRDDLDAVLALADVGPTDHVFFPTAHGREFAALLRLLDGLPAEQLPMFHLEFRHALDMTVGPDHTEHPYVTRHRAFFDFARRFPPHPRIRLYTDTVELSAEYAAFSGQPFATLPIPFRAHLMPARRWEPGQPVTVGYFGDVRDEKGFYLLPAAVDALGTEIAAGTARFVIQAKADVHEAYPRCRDALAALRDRPGVRLVGTAGSLTATEYFGLFGEADVIAMPYDRAAYRRRSSGILTEAAAAGLPTVVPTGTWLASQQPPGAGEQFDSEADFPAAVRKVVADYPRYAAAARDHRRHWLDTHTPANLVRALVG
ncbi:MAG: hypothetical protein ACRC7O_11625 [Fimbriiglobus sp.]